MRSISTLESTRYEVTITPYGKEPLLFIYATRHSGSGLASAIRNQFDHLKEKTGCASWAGSRQGKGPNGVSFSGSGYRIEFSGYTERDRRGGGELPWYRDALPDFSG